MSKELTPLEALKHLEKSINFYRSYYDMYCWSVLNEALEDFEWLKHKLNLTFLNSLSSPEDKMRVMKIMGVEYDETYTK